MRAGLAAKRAVPEVWLILAEREVLVICLAAEVNLKYERLYAYLHDDVTKKRPTVDLVLRLLCSKVRSASARGARLRQMQH